MRIKSKWKGGTLFHSCLALVVGPLCPLRSFISSSTWKKREDEEKVRAKDSLSPKLNPRSSPAREGMGTKNGTLASLQETER